MMEDHFQAGVVTVPRVSISHRAADRVLPGKRLLNAAFDRCAGLFRAHALFDADRVASPTLAAFRCSVEGR